MILLLQFSVHLLSLQEHTCIISEHDENMDGYPAMAWF